MKDEPAVESSSQSNDVLLDDRHLLDTLLEYSPDHIYFKDRESRFIRVSRSLAEWMGLSDPLDAIGSSDGEFFAPEHARKAREDERMIMQTGRALVAVEEREVWPDGRVTWVSTTKAPLRDREGGIIGVFGMSRDVTVRKAAEELVAAQAATLAQQAQMLRDLAARDELTGLLNRRGFFDAATHALKIAQETSRSVVMFFVDLDGLKPINDLHGHVVGDRALVAVADALRTLSDTQLIAGRVGGDEFCLLETTTSFQSRLTEAIIQTAIGQTAAAAGLPKLSASIGRVDAAPDAELIQLIEQSDTIMYARKAQRVDNDEPS